MKKRGDASRAAPPRRLFRSIRYFTTVIFRVSVSDDVCIFTK